MKIIDILNKIANGEEVPKKIKYKGSIYTYLEQEENKIYQYEDYNAVLDIQCFEKLNDEVEIIEEEKKLEKIVQENLVIGSPNGAKVSFSIADSVLLDKINEIIDYLKSKGDE